MGVGERGQPGGVLVACLLSLTAELGDGGVGVAGVPQHYGVEYQAEGAELVFLPFPVGLAQLAALAVEDLTGQPVPPLAEQLDRYQRAQLKNRSSSARDGSPVNRPYATACSSLRNSTGTICSVRPDTHPPREPT